MIADYDRDLRSSDGIIERDPESGNDAGIPESLRSPQARA
jgi:hypothetical protein